MKDEILAGVLTALIMTAVLILLVILSFLPVALFVYLVCWAFGFTYTWKLAIGIYAVIALLGMIFRTTVTIKEK